MPNFDFSQLSALPISELTFAEPAGSAARSEADHKFDDYLKRANDVSGISGADGPLAKNRQSDLASPSKTDDARKPAESPKSDSTDRKPANETAAGAKGNDASSPEITSSATENGQGQNGAEEASTKDAQEGDSKPVENEAAEDKKKTEEEKDGKHEAVESIARADKNPADMTVIAVDQSLQDAAKKESGEKNVSVETEGLKEVATGETLAGDPLAQPGKKSAAAAKSGAGLPLNGDLPLQQMQEAAAKQTAENPADAINDLAEGGKSKAKKMKEAVEGKNAHGKQKTAAENQSAASARQDADKQTATASNDGVDGVKTSSTMPQATANMMQSVLEVMKNAEKSASTDDAVGQIADVRANSSMTAAKTSAAQAGKTASAPAGSDNASQVARAQFVQRVERAFAAMGNRDGSVRLKLSPPELGVLKLEIGVHKGVMRARVEAETPAAQSLLLDNLPDLRDRLAQQNIHIQQFDVDLMDRSLGGMPQNAFGQSDSGSRQNGRSSPKSNGAENAAVSAASASSPQRAGMGGGLNVIV